MDIQSELMAKDVDKEKKERKMLQPVRTKFRKAFKGRIHGNASRAVKWIGQYGLKAVQPEE